MRVIRAIVGAIGGYLILLLRYLGRLLGVESMPEVILPAASRRTN
jgi:hypothetical protein